MRKNRRILLMVLLALFYCKSTVADKISPTPKTNEYKMAIDILGKDKKLNKNFEQTIHSLNILINEKLLFEQILKVIENVADSRLSTYSDDDRIMKLVRDFRRIVNIKSKEKGVEETAIYPLLIEHYKNGYKQKIIEILKHYNKLSSIHNHIYSNNQSVQIQISVDNIVLAYVDNMILDELKILIPSKDIKTVFNLDKHLKKYLGNKSDYIGTLMNAFSMIAVYDRKTLEDILNDKVKMTEDEVCRTLESFAMTGIQAYKIIIEAQSQVLAYVKYNEELEKFLVVDTAEKEKIKSNFETKIMALNEEIENANGRMKAKLKDKLEWLEFEKETDMSALEQIIERRTSAKFDYEKENSQLNEIRSGVRHTLMDVYKEVSIIIGKGGPPDKEVLRKFIDSLVRFEKLYRLPTQKITKN